MKRVNFLSFWLLLSVGMVTAQTRSNTNEEGVKGVIINGVKWATRNVDVPGVFAAKPEDAGRFYQCNRNVAWAATGDVTNWDDSYPAGTTWEKSNDPSPAGWRVPTRDEIKKLFDTDKVSNEWGTENGVAGRRFTDKATNKSIFLPAVGLRDHSDGTLSRAGEYGAYWSSTQSGSNIAYAMYFNSDDVHSGHFAYRSFGLSVRCVAN